MKSILFSAYQQPVNWSFVSMMCLDAVGLIIILACTVFDVFLLWDEEMRFNYNESANMFSSLTDGYSADNGNHSSIFWWFSGHSIQSIGLLYLITHAALMQKYHDLEKIGMFLLLVGPVVNMYSCINYSTESVLGKHPSGDAFGFPLNVTSFNVAFENERVNHNHNGYNMQWLCTEVVEFVGILILNVSVYLEHYPSKFKEDYIILILDVIGFAVLQVAAMAEFDYSKDNSTPTFAELTSSVEISGGISPTHDIPLSGYYPYTTRVFPHRLNFRYDLSHCADGIGLVMLTIVSFAHYASQHEEKLKDEFHEEHYSPATPGTAIRESPTKAKEGDSSWSGRLGRFRNRIGEPQVPDDSLIHPSGTLDDDDNTNPDLTLNLLRSIEEGLGEVDVSLLRSIEEGLGRSIEEGLGRSIEEGLGEVDVSPQINIGTANRFPDMFIPTDVDLPTDPILPTSIEGSGGCSLGSGPPSAPPTVPPSPSKYIYNSKHNPNEFHVRSSTPKTFFPVEYESKLSPPSAKVSHRVVNSGNARQSPRNGWSTSNPSSALVDPEKVQSASSDEGSLWQYVAGINESFDGSSYSKMRGAVVNSKKETPGSSHVSSPGTQSHKHYR